MEKEKAQPICAEEALNLLNCVTDSPFDQDKCLTLLNTLRNCVLHKVLTSHNHNHNHNLCIYNVNMKKIKNAMLQLYLFFLFSFQVKT
ncbi:hypothetical protein LguiA_015744 [Lonicera macranthoides]